MAENAVAQSGLQKLTNVRFTKHYTSLTQDRKWLLIDAKDQSVGRLASQIASRLRGKHKPTYTQHDDVGDFVVVINAKDLQFRGNNKADKKLYYKHTGWPGSLKERTGARMLELKPEVVLELAVKGMLPRGALGSRMLKKLKVYAGAEHPHKAQAPELIKLPY